MGHRFAGYLIGYTQRMKDPEPSLDRSSAEPSFVVLANSAAGSVDTETLGAAVCVLAEHGSVVLRRTETAADVPDALRGHPRSVPVLVGGDGTISSSVDALLGQGLGHVALGIVPSGTGNDFARAAGVPLDPAAAALAVVHGSARRLSMLSVSGLTGPGRAERSGVNALHIGIGAAASRQASSWKSRLGPAAYPLAAAVTGTRSSGARISVEFRGRVPGDSARATDREGSRADAGPTPGSQDRAPTTSMVAVVLGSSIGGGVEIAGSPSLDRSSAEVLRAVGDGLGDRVRLAGALLSSDPGSRRSIESTRAQRLSIRCDRPVPVNLDGEDLGDQASLEVEIVPGAWTMLAPRDG